jgi:NhaA family Na+:H+ antiporter
MAVFFLLIGLEVKRELLEGALKSKETAIFPAIAAVGGMLAPALIYVLFNSSNPEALQGWAIPAATDIAFALGIMALLGNRVPVSLKVFLLALAIIDDLGVVVIIALFYSGDLSTLALTVGFIATGVLFMLNNKHVTKLSVYLIVGAILWFAVLKSGVHATLAGVVIGFAIPLKGNKGEHSPLKHLEHALHPYVAFAILPIFAFANAGISLEGISLSNLTGMLPLGIALGLLVGKPLGIFLFSWGAVKTGVAKLPEGVNFMNIFAVSVLCGIGFTMSIFISSLAFGPTNADFDTLARLGILMGSTTAAVLGYFLLSISLPKTKHQEVKL